MNRGPRFFSLLATTGQQGERRTEEGNHALFIPYHQVLTPRRAYRIADRLDLGVFADIEILQLERAALTMNHKTLARSDEQGEDPGTMPDMIVKKLAPLSRGRAVERR